MNEQFKQLDGGSSPMQNEILQALIGKVIDLGATMHDNTQQLKKLADQQDTLNAVNASTGSLDRQLDELIKNSRAVGEEVKKIGAALNLPTDKLDALQQQLGEHARLFEKPLHKTVHYKHIVG
jgi:hypothetical protein